MTSDRELLEGAARAAGYVLYFWSDKCCRMDIGDYPEWNPLDSDADAFRLMVDCLIDVSYGKGSAHTWVAGISCREHYGTDKHAATRRAVVRAAAAMSEGRG